MGYFPTGAFTGEATNTLGAEGTLIRSVSIDMETREKSNQPAGTVSEEYRLMVRVEIFTELRQVTFLNTISGTAVTSEGFIGTFQGSPDIEVTVDDSFGTGAAEPFVLIHQQMDAMDVRGSEIVGLSQTWLATQGTWTDAPWNG
jgi:hypothetical protein